MHKTIRKSAFSPNLKIKSLVLVLNVQFPKFCFPDDSFCVEIKNLGNHLSKFLEFIIDHLMVNLDKVVD